MTPDPMSKLVPGLYSEAQDLSVQDVARLFSALLEHQDLEEVDEVFGEFIVSDPDLD